MRTLADDDQDDEYWFHSRMQRQTKRKETRRMNKYYRYGKNFYQQQFIKIKFNLMASI